MPRLTITLMHIKITYSTTARHFAWPLLLSNFGGSRKYISHVMVISEELISILRVRASDKRSPVVEQELLNHIYPHGPAE